MDVQSGETEEKELIDGVVGESAIGNITFRVVSLGEMTSQ